VKAYLVTKKGGRAMMIKNKRGVFIGVVCVLATLMVLYFGSVHARAGEAKTVKIGTSLPLSISFGVNIAEGLQACVDKVNQEGGLKVGGERYLINMVIYDDKYRPDVGRAAIERLINADKVTAIVGTAASPVAYASLPVVQAAGVPMFASAWTEKLLDPKLRYVYTTTTARSADCFYSMIVREVEPKIKTAVLAAADHETGHICMEKATKYLKYNGTNILDTFYFPFRTKDNAPIATRMAAKNPDFFAMPGSGGSAESIGLALKAVADTGWRGPMFVTASPVIKDLYEICPAGQADILYVPLTDYTSLPKPPKLAMELREVFEQKYGYWREVGPFWTLPFWFFKASVEKAGSFEPDAIDQAMGKIGVISTPLGEAVMIKRPDKGIDRNIDALVAPTLAKVKGDKAVFVASWSVEDAVKEFENVVGFKGQWK